MKKEKEKGMEFKMENIRFENLLDLNNTIASSLFENIEFVWEVLPKIKEKIVDLGNSLDQNEFEKIGDNIWIHKTAKVSKTVEIIGPCIIDENAEIRHSAFIRGNVIVGKNAVVRKFN